MKVIGHVISNSQKKKKKKKKILGAKTGPLVMKSAKQKGFTRKICQPKFSKVVLPSPSILTLRGIDWFLKKVKNEAGLGGNSFCYKDQCARMGLSQAEVNKTKAFVKAVCPGGDLRGRNGGQVEWSRK